MNVVYKYTKLIIYHILVILFGIAFTIFFAIFNGLISFIHVWMYGPFLKITILWVYALTPLLTVPLRAMVDVCARSFRQFRIQAKFTGFTAGSVAGQKSNV